MTSLSRRATALAGGAAFAAHLPGAVQVVLGVALFFAPGYLWSEAILSQRLPPTERLLTSAGMSLILPILGGFLFYALHIPLFRVAWVGLLVVLTLLGVVAVAVQRLREVRPSTRACDPNAQREEPASPAKGRDDGVQRPHLGRGRGGRHRLRRVFRQERRGAEIPRLHDAVASNAPLQTRMRRQASLGVTNHQGVAEQYRLKFLTKGKVTATPGTSRSAMASRGHAPLPTR